MSKYSVNQTVLREEKYLVEALKEMGYEVEVHPQGGNLNSYYSGTRGKDREHYHQATAPTQSLWRYRVCAPARWSAHPHRRRT